MKTITALSISIFVTVAALAQTDEKLHDTAAALVASLNFHQGQVVLQDGLATLNVPEGFRYLNGADANKVIVDLWGNPPGETPLGLLMPDISPINPESWAVIVTYEDDGYVKDHDAEKINYDDLLKDMKQGVSEANSERTKNGYPAIELIDWAAPPRYDRETHKLHWAKELKFSGSRENTLNYNIRMLGRRGVLVLNAVASMSQLAEIEKATPQILSAIDYNSGHRYADFNPASGDKVATYGIAALVTGGVAAKLGFFKIMWVAILAAKKFIIIGAVAIGAAIKKLFGKKNTATT